MDCVIFFCEEMFTGFICGDSIKNVFGLLCYCGSVNDVNMLYMAMSLNAVADYVVHYFQ